MRDLFSSFGLGNIELKNRIVMAPMTRSRAIEGNVPSPLAVQYYEQRASAGLIITEGAQVSPQGVGYIRTPGIHSAEQVEGWKKVTSSVHRKGGKIFLQLWHVGRASHPDFHDGELPVAPSAIGFEGEAYTPQGRKKTVAPRALELSEIPGIVEQFRKAAQNARDAGFDGVEIHGANGYLLDQFTRDGSNQRTDAYGGSVENRIRLPLEVTRAVISVFGADRVGYRISPHNPFNGMSDSNPVETFSALARGLDQLGIGYLHILEAISGQMHVPNVTNLTPVLRTIFKGAYIVNGGYDKTSAHAVLERDEADLVAFGVPFISNPDLVERLKKNATLNAPDFATFYMGEEKGYIDYPVLA
ncbi:MAG: alkene reductase [Bdellovibrionia bacterium]